MIRAACSSFHSFSADLTPGSTWVVRVTDGVPESDRRWESKSAGTATKRADTLYCTVQTSMLYGVLLSLFWVGGWMGGGVNPAFPLPATTSFTLRGALKDGSGEAVMTCDIQKPCELPSLDSCQKRFPWALGEADLALHPDIGLVLQANLALHPDIGLVLQANLALHPVIGLVLQADLALHPVIGLVLQVGDAKTFPQALGLGGLFIGR